MADVEDACFELPQGLGSVNGVSLQGRSLNGVQLQGVSLQGVSLQGIQMNGVQVNGAQINGVQVNGAQINGLQVNGAQINGVQINGIWENGVWQNGVQINGSNLNASRLRGRGAKGVHVADNLEVRVDGGRLIVEVDGARIKDDALVGSVLFATDGDAVYPLTITSIEDDAEDDRLAFYGLELDGASICEEGSERGVFVAGAFDESGRWSPDPSGGTISYACANGVMNKCVRWGYKPWTAGDDAYQTCTRMARADYCGDGAPHTKEGTSIDNYDDLGIQRRGAADDETYVFEAGWSADGAVCLAHPRWTDQGSIEQIHARCPRLAAIPHCDEASARALGARMFNYSRIQ